jgi:GNAT superfamily N-acetyltransferase
MSEMTASAVQQQPSDFVDQDFARRLEMAEMILPDCFEALRRYAPSDPIAAEHIAGGIAFFGGVTYPANQIVGMGFEGEVTSQDLDRVENFFRGRGVASTVVVSPLAHESLRTLLGDRGYRIAEFNSVLIRRINSHTNSGEPFTLPPGVAIERVTPETAKPWMSAIAKGFAQDISVAEEVFGGFAALPDALAFLARIEGKVVGGCGGRIIPQARIAAFFGTATLPEFRRLGVQSALIAQRLHEAALTGCEYAVVSTHPGSGSQRNMERRGFRLAYTKVVMMRDWPETPKDPSGGH